MRYLRSTQSACQWHFLDGPAHWCNCAGGRENSVTLQTHGVTILCLYVLRWYLLIAFATFIVSDNVMYLVVLALQEQCYCIMRERKEQGGVIAEAAGERCLDSSM